MMQAFYSEFLRDRLVWLNRLVLEYEKKYEIMLDKLLSRNVIVIDFGVKNVSGFLQSSSEKKLGSYWVQD